MAYKNTDPSLSYFNRYVISAPKVFHVGASENVVIQVYGYTEEFDATVSIRSFPDKKVTYSSVHVTLSAENKFQNLWYLSWKLQCVLKMTISHQSLLFRGY